MKLDKNQILEYYDIRNDLTAELSVTVLECYIPCKGFR